MVIVKTLEKFMLESFFIVHMISSQRSMTYCEGKEKKQSFVQIKPSSQS